MKIREQNTLIIMMLCYLCFFTLITASLTEEVDFGSRNDVEKQWVKFLQPNEDNSTTIKSLLVKTNSSSTSVEFQYRESDDSFKSWTVFYSQNIQIFKSIYVGEVNLNHAKYQFNCYLMYYDEIKIAPFKSIEQKLKEFSFVDTMKSESKLDPDVLLMDYMIHHDQLDDFGDGIKEACFEADVILTNQVQVQKIKEKHGSSSLPIHPHSTLRMDQIPLCYQTSEGWEQRCRCQTFISIGWYPCGAKLCDDADTMLLDDEDNSMQYYCGMKYCSRQVRFMYLIQDVKHCLPIIVL